MFSIRHVGITVQSIEKSLKLYEDYFKFKVVWDEIEQGKFIDGLSGIDLNQTYGELLKMGLVFNEKPKVSPDGGAMVCFGRDFDGTLIELVEVLN